MSFPSVLGWGGWLELEGIEPSPTIGPDPARRTKPAPKTASEPSAFWPFCPINPRKLLILDQLYDISYTITTGELTPLETYEKADNVVQWKWDLKQYESQNGRKAIDDWRRNLPQGPFRAALDTFLRTMAKIDEWKPPHIKALQGKENAGLSELRWTSGKIEHRIIGHRLDDTKADTHQYLMLIGCTHKQRNYIPPEALESARTRRSEIQQGVAAISEYHLIADR
jgi:hypothetical protein